MRSKYYQGNKNLYKEYTRQEYTPEQMEEILKCRNDIEYFAEHYVRIINPFDGKILIKLYDEQKEDFVNIKENIVTDIDRGRATGKTTSMLVYILHHILYQSDNDVAIISNKEYISKSFLNLLKHVYENLPMWMKHSVKKWNKGTIELDNGISVLTGSASNAHILRGRALSILAIDDLQNIQESDLINLKENTYPAIMSTRDSKVITTGTKWE